MSKKESYPGLTIEYIDKFNHPKFKGALDAISLDFGKGAIMYMITIPGRFDYACHQNFTNRAFNAIADWHDKKIDPVKDWDEFCEDMFKWCCKHWAEILKIYEKHN